MATPRQHIEEIRKTKFKDNPLTEELHQAVKLLSAELYTKDAHFVMELIQNAEDNTYASDVDPSLEFVFTTKDVAGVGAIATLLVFNNEIGFQKHNIDSICSVGRSTKKNKREGGYIGEKGIGFKSVFLVTSQPYIFSNGYKIRFNEVPPADVNIGYIVPEWIESRPSIAQLEEIYGRKLPNTVIVLPLRAEKVEAVQKELSSIHPEIILFMSKIKKLSVREVHLNASFNKINAISVSREMEFQTFRSEDSESFTLHLSAEESKRSIGQSSYYIWRQRFPVKNECKIEQRKDVGKWEITLAFPRDERLTKEDIPAPGIYAFLPTEIVTGFPFVIQADFILVSSRESIILDNKWNQGILGCIPLAFCSAFSSLIYVNLPPSSKCDLYRYLPADNLRYQPLAQVRDEIRVQLRREEIILCDSSFVDRDFGRPTEARRILPAFRSILERARQEGQQRALEAFLAGEVQIVHPCLDKPEFSNIFKFLKVEYASYDWYAGCIQSCDLKSLPETLYVELLCFIAENWEQGLSSYLQNTLFLKFEISSNNIAFASVLNDEMGRRIYFSSEQSHISWLTEWSGELQNAAQHYFMPESTQKVIKDLDGNKVEKLSKWLEKYPKITEPSISSFSQQLRDVVIDSTNSKLVVNVVLFFHFSTAKNFIHARDLFGLCSKIPVVDDRGIVRQRDSVKLLLPASVSKWAKLMGSNPWTGLNFVTLSEAYLTLPPCARGLSDAREDLVLFIKQQLGALDIPLLVPPNAHFTVASYPLTKENAFELLAWIGHLYPNRQLMPRLFRHSVSEGKWLKTSKGFESPDRSFLFGSEWSSSSLVKDDVPCIDEAFYGKEIHVFRDALEKVGVVVKVGEGCNVIIDHHIQMHTDFEAIKRLYKYLKASKWEPQEAVLPIWIPKERKWMSPESCVIHDVHGLFKLRLKVLEGWYDEALLEFFSNSLGVPSHPQIEDYCSLWLDRAGSDNHRINESECCLIWKHIVQNWTNSSSSIKQCLGSGCIVPVCTNNGDIHVSSPGQSFVPNDLHLKELFNRVSKFTWHPNPSDPEIPLDLLFSVYNDMGVRNISEAVNKTDISISTQQKMCLQKLQPGQGVLGSGLYRLVIAYLAKPSFKLSADKRHQLVKDLIDCPVCGVAESLRMEYSLLTDQNTKVKRETVVRWEKNPNRLLIQTPDRNNKKAKMLFATAFAEEISHGLLAEFPDLVGGLCDLIILGCAFDFDLEAVDFMLQSRNLRLFVEDERFLSSHSKNLSGVTIR